MRDSKNIQYIISKISRKADNTIFKLNTKKFDKLIKLQTSVF